MDALFQDSDFISDNSSTDASVDFDSDEFSDLLDNIGNLLSQLSGGGNHQGLGVHWWSVDDLQNRNSETSCFAGTWLSLLNIILIKYGLTWAIVSLP